MKNESSDHRRVGDRRHARRRMGLGTVRTVSAPAASGPRSCKARPRWHGPGHDAAHGPGDGPRDGPRQMGQCGNGARHDARAAGPTHFDPARIETVKNELGITAAQEPAWTKYAGTVQDAAAAMKAAREGVDPDTIGKMSPQDRFASVSKMREQAQKQFETVKTAAKELLAALDDTQKAKARQTLPGLAFGPGHERAAGMGGPQHQH